MQTEGNLSANSQTVGTARIIEDQDGLIYGSCCTWELFFLLWHVVDVQRILSVLVAVHICRKKLEWQISFGLLATAAYFYAKRFRPTGYKNVSHFPCPCQRQYPVESLCKVIAASIGIAGEFVTGFKHGRWAHMGNAQHITMFFFFGVNGVVDLLQHKKWDMPSKLDYVSAIIAFSIEGFLFFFHLHGRLAMDVMIHMFLFYAIVACAISTFVEMLNPASVIAALSRVFFTLLQGTWFLQIGFILYPPVGDKWDEMSHDQMMVVTLMFTWHVAALLATMFGIGTLIYVRVQNLQDSFTNYQLVETNENSFRKESQSLHLNGRINGSDADIHQILDSESEEA